MIRVRTVAATLRTTPEPDSQAAELTPYRGAERELFLPLQDATSGTETYGAGQFLEPTMLGDGRVLVDFSYRYNPCRAFDDAWSSPLPPRENWRTLPIRAGEKTLHPEP